MVAKTCQEVSPSSAFDALPEREQRCLPVQRERAAPSCKPTNGEEGAFARARAAVPTLEKITAPIARSSREKEGLRGEKSEFERVVFKTRASIVERPGGGSDPEEDHCSNLLPDQPEKKRD
ncbi:hypothetical protein MRB53_005943 [Persea americana]|uniref:Uncharacterized protein n=1 Tax=Persea americana TaxID=3435 RepID=A0ACC2MFG3_PERAE|nr:hypothetical protein MRB53_005943 [Persea americana]